MSARPSGKGRGGPMIAALATAILLTALATVSPLRAEPDGLTGVWLTAPDPDGRSHVEIVEDGDGYRGRIVWLEKPTYPEDDPGGMPGRERIDRNNPDDALNSRPILGLELLAGFEPSGKGRWQGGTIYDPTNGKTYKCKLRLEGETLHVRGYIGFSLIGRTTEWTRVDSP